jgi:hypothetical protein
MPRCGGLSMETKNSSEDLVCFKSHPIIRDLWIQIHQCFLLWKQASLAF